MKRKNFVFYLFILRKFEEFCITDCSSLYIRIETGKLSQIIE